MEQKNIMKYCKCGCGQEIIDNNYTNKQFVNFHQNRGRKFPTEFGRKISKTLKGHHVSDETRKKISDSLKGHSYSSCYYRNS